MAGQEHVRIGRFPLLRRKKFYKGNMKKVFKRGKISYVQGKQQELYADKILGFYVRFIAILINI